MTARDHVSQADDPDYGRRELFLAHVAQLSEWPLALGERPINALFIATERMPEADDVSALADHVISRGVFYVSCWGEGCEFVHDLFDEEDLRLHPPVEGQKYAVVMTTWHDDESLAEALEFFWIAACPDDGKEWGPNYLALSVGSDALHASLRAAADAL